MTLNEKTFALLRAHFGFDAFRPGQQEAIQSLIAGQNTLVMPIVHASFDNKLRKI
jgi:superfamily II DNA helicase RecQ